MGEAKALVRNTALLFGSDIFINILALVLIVVIARFIGDVGLGKYSFAFAFAGLFIVIADFGLGQLMIREIARNKRIAQRYFWNALGLKLFLFIAMLVLPIVIIVITQKSAEVALLVGIAALATVFLYSSYFMRWLIQSYELMQYEALIKTVEKVLTFGLVLAALLLGFGLIGLFVAIALAYFLAFLLSCIIVVLKITPIKLSFEPTQWKKMLKASFPFWLGGVFFLIYFRIDTVMLTYMTNFAVVGWYNAAFRLVEGLSFIPLIFITATFPVMSRLYTQNKAQLKQLINHSVRYLVILAIPIAVGTTVIASRIISFLYPAEFMPAIIALQILIWAESLLFVNMLLGYSLNAINKQTRFTITAGVCAVANILLNFVLIPAYSYKGAAAATVVTQIFSFGMLYYFLSKSYRFNLTILLKPAIAGAVMGLALWQFRTIAIWWSVPLAAIIYFAAIFAIKGLGKEDLKLTRYLIPKRFLGTPQTED